MSLLANDGADDWKHLYDKLKEHENNVENITHIEKLFEIFNVTRNIEWSSNLYIEKYMIENIDKDTFTNNFVSKNTRENCFLWAFEY